MILLLFNWKVNRNALFLSVLMILIASCKTRQYLVLHGKEPFWMAIFINNPGPLWSMIGPCLFFYVRSVLTDRFEFRRSDLLHTLPALVLIFPEILYGIPRRRETAEITISLAEPPPTVATPTEETDIAIPDTDPEAPRLPEGPADDPFRDLGQRVLHYMEQEKPFLQPDFSIEQLAEMLDVPRHHLYYCFKNILQKKFVTLRTEYRVREAKGMLMNADLKEMTLEGIGRRCGFTSRTAFYRLFTEQTGCSPGEYHEKNRPLRPAEDQEIPGAGQSAPRLG